MSLHAAILATLLVKAGSGYEISKDDIDSCVNAVWQVPQQQVYRELKAMEAKGWISSKIVPGDRALDKKIYDITESGRKHLAEWVSSPVEPAATRDALLIKMFAGYIVDLEVILAELERHQHIHQTQLDHFEFIQTEYFADPETIPPHKNFAYLALLHRMGEERHWVEWCIRAKALLKATQTG